jgi:tetratricopeptide (TPR) repeat protein
MNNATTEKARIKLYLPAELYSQLEFRSNVDLGSMSAIVERAIANFLAQEGDAENSDSQPDKARIYPDYDKLIEVNPNDDYKAWYGRGVMLKNLGRYEEAIASLDKALEIKPDYYKAWYSRGNALYALDFYEEAIFSYEKAIQLKPDFAQAWYEKGKALDKLGDRQEAIASRNKALEIQPKTDVLKPKPNILKINRTNLTINQYEFRSSEVFIDTDVLADLIETELQPQILSATNIVKAVATRIAKEVNRICCSSSRIQKSGCVGSWQRSLAQHRMAKCLKYYNLGSKQARIELHSTLGAIAYRYIAPMRSPFSFQIRYHLLEDFLQSFYMESLTVFRREHQLTANYTPRTILEVVEYMAFTEQYARRRITLKRGNSQQLIVLRAQGFARRLPTETTLDTEAIESLDIEAAAESSEAEPAQVRSPEMQKLRALMVSEAVDPAEGFLRDRVVEELVQYLESIGQSDCVDYLILKLQDFSAPEIDEILGLEARQRDYLQQRFKYHVEKFSKHHQWELVHQYLGAALEENLGMNQKQWEVFWQQLKPDQQHLLQLKRTHASEEAIANSLQWTPKQVQKCWFQLLEKAWRVRNGMDNSPLQQLKSS